MVLCLFALSLSIFASDASGAGGLLHSYEYNRLASGKRDFLLGLSVGGFLSGYRFRDKERKITDKGTERGLPVIRVDARQRLRGFSLFEDVSFWKKKISLSGREQATGTFAVRFGAQKDFLWIVGSRALTASAGGGVSFRVDKIDSPYRSTFMAGPSVELCLEVPLFGEALTPVLLFLGCHGDLYIWQNATSGGGSVRLSEAIVCGSVSVGVHFNLSSLSRTIQEKRLERLEKGTLI